MRHAREPDHLLITLPGPAWVRCPRCDRAAQVVRQPHRYPVRADARLRCGHCGFAHDHRHAFIATRARHAGIARWAPRCDRCGRPAPRGTQGRPRQHGGALSIGWRCPGCGHVSRFPAQGIENLPRDGHDHWFGLPLILSEPVGAHLLWAYNRQHIEMLIAWLGASLRERSHRPYHATMMARLPRWMKTASARPKIRAALTRLRDRAEREGLT